MKRTKNMIYKPTEEARELTLFITNTEELYPQICAIIRNLAKKYRKGIYNADKAIDAFYPVATIGSNLYNRYFGYTFSVTDRFTCATDMVDYYNDNIVNNDI